MRRSHRSATAAVVLGVLLVCPALAASATPGSSNENPFGAASLWRTSLEGAPIDPDSQAMVDRLVSTVTDRYGGVAAFNAHQYDSPLYTVDSSTPKVDVAFDDCQRKGYAPAGLVGPDGAFRGVPIPSDAVAATGTDAELSVYSSATDQLWEFWNARRTATGGWSACWGGRLDAVSTSTGVFAGQYGATATGLPNAGGLVRWSEIAAGRITHLMSLAIPSPAVWSRYRWPAQRSDGSDTDAAAIPEGSRLRLDPSIDVTRMGLTAAGVTIARAAQQYGFVVVDKAGAVAVLAEARPAASTASPDPWRSLLGGPDYAVLKNFPWKRLQVVADGWRGPAAAAPAPSATTPAPPSTDALVVARATDPAAPAPSALSVTVTTAAPAPAGTAQVEPVAPQPQPADVAAASGRAEPSAQNGSSSPADAGRSASGSATERTRHRTARGEKKHTSTKKHPKSKKHASRKKRKTSVAEDGRKAKRSASGRQH